MNGYPDLRSTPGKAAVRPRQLIVEAGKVTGRAEAVRWIVWTRGAAKSLGNPFGHEIYSRDSQCPWFTVD